MLLELLFQKVMKEHLSAVSNHYHRTETTGREKKQVRRRPN